MIVSPFMKRRPARSKKGGLFFGLTMCWLVGAVGPLPLANATNPRVDREGLPRVSEEPLVVAKELPGEIPIERDGGKAGLILIKLELENGGEVKLALDTGSPITVFDKSLVPQLGKRLGSETLHFMAYGWKGGSAYKAPKLTLNGVPLMTGKMVAVQDTTQVGPKGLERRGLLGLDCLQHYCLQLDFVAGKVRFLDSGHLNTAELGQAIPIDIPWARRWVWVDGNLIGTPGARSIVDTGDGWDGGLSREHFRHAIEKHWASLVGKGDSTVEHPVSEIYMEKAVFGEKSYQGLVVHESTENDMIGLNFLSRHLVTFDFPHHIMYLKPNESTHVGTLGK